MRFRGAIARPDTCRQLVRTAVEAFGRIDLFVTNAAYQMTRESIDEITDDEWDHTFDVNIGTMFRITKAAVGHMRPGASNINTTSN